MLLLQQKNSFEKKENHYGVDGYVIIASLVLKALQLIIIG